MDRALSLDESNHLRNRILGRDREQDVNVVSQQMTFQNPALLLLCQPAYHLPQMRSQLFVDQLPSALRNENDVVRAIASKTQAL
jgi:hypothetical protein